MGDSWEDQQGKGVPKLNVAAKPFVFNPNARSFTPGGAASVKTEEVTAKMAAATIQEPAPSNNAVDKNSNNDDENDPLWQAVYKMAGGDREKTEKMLEDPDSLMQYPEIRALLGGGETGSEEKVGGIAESVDTKPIEKDEPPPAPAPSTGGASGKAAIAPAPTVVEDSGNGGEEDVQDEDPREHLNLVFIGHVDAGKSTMSGQLLYLTGQVDKRTIERFEKEAKQLNRESWFLAFIMDTNEEERAKGKTVEVGRAHFETDTKRYTIMEAPGHKNYVPNMIAGAVQADVGILVISARRGEFE